MNKEEPEKAPQTETMTEKMNKKKEDSKFELEKEDGYTTPIRIWFASYTKNKKLGVDKNNGELINPTDITIFDDIWYKLSMLMTEKAEHQFTMERVDKLLKIIVQKEHDMKPYFEM